MSNARDIADAGHQLVAWVNFTGTGTPAIQASFNVSSVSSTVAGTYTVTFANEMDDGNYAIVEGGSRSLSGTTAAFKTTFQSIGTTSFVMKTLDAAGNNSNHAAVSIAIFR